MKNARESTACPNIWLISIKTVDLCKKQSNNKIKKRSKKHEKSNNKIRINTRRSY